MTHYQIVCTEQEPVSERQHGHIVAVGVDYPFHRYPKRWTLADVLGAMDKGDVFYTVGNATGRVAIVEKYYCSTCGRYHIRSKQDALPDNNLDNLKICRW